MRGTSNAPKIVHSNKNLLDNWDFTNPVNQRGQSSYSSVGYTIDRWKITEQSKITVNSDSINVKGRMYQLLEDFAALKGKTVTLSLFYTNNTNSTEGRINVINGSTWLSENVNIKANVSKNIISTTFTIPNTLSEFAVNFISENATIKLHAYKLELGEVSTLKNDALGVSYAEELRKCQRYYYDSRTESAISDGRIRMTEADNYPSVVTGNVFFPAQMRAKPAITIYSDQGNVGNLNNSINGEELTGLGAYANFYGRDCFSQVNLNKPLSQVTTVKEVCFHYTASAEL